MTPFLKERSIDSPRMVAEILLGAVLDVERLRLYMEPDRELDPSELARLRELVGRAARHEPVQFLVGRWPFLGRDFEVEPCTLILVHAQSCSSNGLSRGFVSVKQVD
jgi:release factor glutamine methyltransferase